MLHYGGLFSPAQLEQEIRDGWVSRRPHPDLPLHILNYTPATQYKQRWNDVTLNCRGLIVAENQIVARPFKKFFNLGEVSLPIQFDDPVEVMDKADGSLGILYPTPDGYSIATRGSFVSGQAIKATAIWKDKYEDEVLPHADQYDYTFLFEIIFPENRIVLDYGDMEDLVLLGAVSNKAGDYLSPTVAQEMLNWPGPVVEVMPFNTLSDAIAHNDRSNAEGYVIRSHNFMVKLKQEDYLSLHRIVTNLSPKVVWEELSTGKTVQDICKDIPDEFYGYVNSMAEPILIQFDKLQAKCYDDFNNIKGRVGLTDRKTFAIEAQKSKHKAAMFSLLDEKSIEDYLWKSVKPKNTDGLSTFNITS